MVKKRRGLISELFALMECSHGCRDHKILNLLTVACLQQPQQSQHLMSTVIWNSECKQHGCTLYHSSSTGSRWWGCYAVCLSSAPPPIACSDDWNQIVPLRKKRAHSTPMLHASYATVHFLKCSALKSRRFRTNKSLHVWKVDGYLWLYIVSVSNGMPYFYI
jgi:hypothetical protein